MFQFNSIKFFHELIEQEKSLPKTEIDDGSVYQHMKQAEKIGEAVIVSARILL